MKRIVFFISILIVLTLLFAYGATFYGKSPMLPSGDSLAPPSFEHFLGTDDLGVDIFAQLSRGYFHSLLLGLSACIVTFIVGGFLGVLGGYCGGIIDDVVSSIINLFLSVPQIPIMIVMGAFFGQSVFNIVIIVAMFSWASIAKIVRAKTISIRKRNYIMLASSFGGNFLYVFLKHMKSEIIPVLAVNSVAVIGKAIIQEASIAFLGLSDPTSKSWGLMINKAIEFKGIYFTNYWTWWILPPLISLIVTILCIRCISKEIEHIIVSN